MTSLCYQIPQNRNSDLLLHETLHFITSNCLWHEPHTLQELIAKTENADFQIQATKRDQRKSLCTSLRKAISRGTIQYTNGLYLLTLQGREEMAD